MASSVWTVGENAQQQLAGARPCGPDAVARLPLVNTSTAVQTRHMQEAPTETQALTIQRQTRANLAIAPRYNEFNLKGKLALPARCATWAVPLDEFASVVLEWPVPEQVRGRSASAEQRDARCMCREPRHTATCGAVLNAGAGPEPGDRRHLARQDTAPWVSQGGSGPKTSPLPTKALFLLDKDPSGRDFDSVHAPAGGPHRVRALAQGGGHQDPGPDGHHARQRDHQHHGVLYVKIIDPYNASYGVEDPLYAVTQLAQTTMRSELGKITLDKTFEERESLNLSIVEAINQASEAWGIKCLRYEIRDIAPPRSVKAAMDMQAEAERRKRAEILDSEGERQAYINVAEGKKRAAVLEAEGAAAAILAKANASAEAIQRLSAAIQETGGRDAVALQVAEKYVDAFGNIAKEGTTVLLPANTNDPSSMVASALSIFGNIQKQNGKEAARIAAKADKDSAEGELGEYTLDSFDSDKTTN
ncbi:hypothetical protein ON010_g13679 [Phytophthora cinnamomi]|nr:hypothetical protein ON010_g13679 [Phytophthora cinnamomi]